MTLQDSRTMYSHPPMTRQDIIALGGGVEGVDPRPDPNAPIPLCPGCAEDHHKYWDDTWAEYYRGLL